MKHAHRRAATAGGLALAGLAAVAVATFAVLGAETGSGWAMHDMTDGAAEAQWAAMDAELGAIEAERAAFLEGIGVAPPGLDAETAAVAHERIAPILARYAAAFADGATPDAGTLEALNAEYDALLAEYGAAPQALTAEQASAIAEYRDAEEARMEAVYASYEEPGLSGLSEEDSAELDRIDEEAEAIAVRFGFADPAMTAEQEFTLAARLAPIEHRYDALYDKIDAIYEELDRLDAINRAIASASGMPPTPALTDEQWDEYWEAMRPLEMRAEEIYSKIYGAPPQ